MELVDAEDLDPNDHPVIVLQDGSYVSLLEVKVGVTIEHVRKLNNDVSSVGDGMVTVRVRTNPLTPGCEPVTWTRFYKLLDKVAVVGDASNI